MEIKEEGLSWANDPLWYKDAVIYQLHIKSFYDSDHDGYGDFQGLVEKLDYIKDLGVNTIWLLPFYPSPLRDDGYDISDYRNINPQYGTRKDFKLLLKEAHRRGIKVITELVINHTSDQHQWFQLARAAPPGSSKRNFYVWSDTDQKFPETRIIFKDTETSNWAWDPIAKAYYWHRFFSHQPDLNHNNPTVVKAIIRVMRYWLDMGVDGMRLDAVPYLCVREGTNNENLPETHAVIKQIRSVVDSHYQNRMFLAEANQWPEDVRDYFADGDECHMAYHFPLMTRLYMAVAQEDRHPITEIMRQTPDIPETCQWAIFLRNHDELTLEMVTDRERDYMYQIYSADPRMRINLGIRRRLAPLMNNDMDKIKLMKSLLMSMPGTPIIYYGDEIGMGDNIYLGDRNGVRTPMQWSPDRNAGFSRADPQRLFFPPIMDPIYGYEAVNVEAQSRDPSSLLNWTKQLIAVRNHFKAFGRGTLEFLRPGNRKILAYIRQWQDEIILCVTNLARTAQPVELDLSAYRGHLPVEMMGRSVFPPIGELPYMLTLPGYGFFWFRLTTEVEEPLWHEERLPPLELPVVVLFDGMNSFFPEKVVPSRKWQTDDLRKRMELEILTHYLPSQRWFAAKGDQIDRIELTEMNIWTLGSSERLFLKVKVHFIESESHTYFLPLSLVWGEIDEEGLRSLRIHTVTKIRQRERVGILCDAFADESFTLDLVKSMHENQEVAIGEGRLRYSSTSELTPIMETLVSNCSHRLPEVLGSNTTVILGDQLFLKVYRRLHPGICPELEIGRFLTEVSPFPNIVPVAGALEYEISDEEPVTLALLQRYVGNQGDAWGYTLDYLRRFLEDSLLSPPEETVPSQNDIHGAYLMMMQKLGQRTAQLHQALSKVTGDSAFDPEPVRREDLTEWVKRVQGEILISLDQLGKEMERLPASIREDAGRLLDLKNTMLKTTADWAAGDPQCVRMRYHGDYHLAQVLLAENDFIIIDFEGEPGRPAKERRIKHCPLRDVAGMLRSFNYAAYAALFDMSADRPDDYSRLEVLVRDWEQKTVTAFLAGYEDTIQGCSVWPRDPDQARSLLDLFTMEKALYELRYELNHRPEWIRIPLTGLLDLFASR